LDGSLK
jgi:hypothetical protein